ncbi:MAG: hypothetical protein H7836_18355, partial [Magnetococcus sp. YQC-3]
RFALCFDFAFYSSHNEDIAGAAASGEFASFVSRDSRVNENARIVIFVDHNIKADRWSIESRILNRFE